MFGGRYLLRRGPPINWAGEFETGIAMIALMGPGLLFYFAIDRIFDTHILAWIYDTVLGLGWMVFLGPFALLIVPERVGMAILAVLVLAAPCCVAWAVVSTRRSQTRNPPPSNASVDDPGTFRPGASRLAARRSIFKE